MNIYLVCSGLFKVRGKYSRNSQMIKLVCNEDMVILYIYPLYRQWIEITICQYRTLRAKRSP